MNEDDSNEGNSTDTLDAMFGKRSDTEETTTRGDRTDSDRSGDASGDASSEAPTNDRDLFAAFLAGDDGALMELFDRHTHRLYLYAMKFVERRQQAEDLVQDVWERVIRMRERDAEAPRQPLALLYTITRNLCLNHIRDRRRLSPLEAAPEWQRLASNPEGLSQHEEMVIAALEHLPIEQREILVLHAYSGYRYEEIAEMHGVAVGTVRTRAWRARNQLGRVISAMIEFDESRVEQRPDGNQSDESTRKDDRTDDESTSEDKP